MSGKNLLRLRASLSMLVFQYPASMCDSMQKALQRHRRLPCGRRQVTRNFEAILSVTLR